ncbi:unnamed protein product [Leuciscus chuanchicus]
MLHGSALSCAFLGSSLATLQRGNSGQGHQTHTKTHEYTLSVPKKRANSSKAPFDGPSSESNFRRDDYCSTEGTWGDVWLANDFGNPVSSGKLYDGVKQELKRDGEGQVEGD